MRIKQLPFERIPNITILLFIIFIFTIKIPVSFLIINGLIDFGLGGGPDSDYYHSYAIGNTDYAVNSWPRLLRYLNDLGLYSRNSTAFMLLILNLFLIPILACKISGLSFKKDQKYFLYLFLICNIYPTLFFFSTDIYRDVYMVFIFLVGCLIVNKYMYTNNYLLAIFYMFISIIIGVYLIKLRPYLGYSYILSLFLWRIKLNRRRVYILSIIYLIFIFLVYRVGLLDVLVEYRAGFEDRTAGSTLGLNFSNPLLFIPNLILSLLGQLFGLYIINPFALILFIIETIPFSIMLIYIIKNIKLADSFARFLIIFFVVYASVWLIGNDNLGTAVRLRFYNYFAVYICFFYILRLKQLMTSNNMQVK